MKKTTLLLAAALFLASSATRGIQAQAADTVQSVIDKHIAALGGREALMKLTNRKATGKVAISTPNGDIPGDVELYSKAPTKSRALLSLDLSAMGAGTVVIEQIFDGVAGWANNPMAGDQEITGRQLENMKNNHFPSPFLEKDNGGGKIELLPRETVAGKSWIVMKISRPSGNYVTLYFDPATYLIARSVTEVENPQGGMLVQASESQDYRVVDGVKVPFVIINTNDVQTITIKLTKVEHNVAMDDSMFKKK
jgi:hypothetical protein